MYKAWTSASADIESLARGLEAHLNEYAAEVISVCYAISGEHYVMAVYRELDLGLQEREEAEAAINVAEHIIDQAHC